ncbi:MAG: hypothetical protein LBJ08_04550 [Bifidobacteriaceae bacterium]|jgi:hypothetical protein|nr:hypothetical protein [Bifidobacteriaceae bacterium]
MADREALRIGLARAVEAAEPGLGERIERGDREASLDLVYAANAAAQETNAILREAVLSARRLGASWAMIGERLNLTRQAVQQRFGPPALDGADERDAADARDPRVIEPAELFEPPSQLRSSPDGEMWRLTPVTALDEMECLERLGRRGWHSVGYGMLYHDLLHDEVQWEHRRLLAFKPGARLREEGWRLVGLGWFPFVYYTRPTDKPAEP